MRLLILVIYSKSLHSHNMIDTYFIRSNMDQEDDIVINNDIINIKCEENYMNILYKSLKAMDYMMKKNNYDFVIRSNISTIIKINEVYERIKSLQPNNFYGGSKFIRNPYLAPIYGLNLENKKKYNLDKMMYVGGTFIIFSKNIVEHMVTNITLFDHRIIDDVAFGVYIDKYFGEIVNNGHKHKIDMNMNTYEPEKNLIIRNKTNNRSDDAKRMNEYVKKYIATYTNL